MATSILDVDCGKTRYVMRDSKAICGVRAVRGQFPSIGSIELSFATFAIEMRWMVVVVSQRSVIKVVQVDILASMGMNADGACTVSHRQDSCLKQFRILGV